MDVPLNEVLHHRREVDVLLNAVVPTAEKLCPILSGRPLKRGSTQQKRSVYPFKRGSTPQQRSGHSFKRGCTPRQRSGHPFKRGCAPRQRSYVLFTVDVILSAVVPHNREMDVL